MRTHLHGLMAACSGVALVALVTAGLPEPAHAQFGGIAGMIINHMGHGKFSRGGDNCGRRCRGSSSRRASRERSSSDDAEMDTGSRKDRNDRVLATLAAPSSRVQNEVLKNVSVSTTITEVGTTKDLAALGKAASKEADRDWTKKVQLIIAKFQRNQDKRITTPGDVTEHAIEQSLEKAIKNAKLDIFESFIGENWTAERLRVKILDRVLADVDRLFEGNNRGYAPMQELDNLIQRHARGTYRRIFEVSELLAANRGSALFVQRLYQTHGGLVDDQLREVTDSMITRTSNAALGKFEVALRQDENGFALRYRAQRIVFDCLSENVERISSSETGIATVDEIQQKIEDTGKKDCLEWLERQFGADARALLPQKPMPLRVVWSFNGPKDDPSMYGRPTDRFQ